MPGARPVYGTAITELFTRATNATTDAELSRWMTDQAPRAGGQPWQSSEIRRWLANRVYLGEVHYGALVNAEAHEPLTDPDTFARAQKAPGAPRAARARAFLLSGLVRCACCRYSMGGFNYGGRDHATPVYRCSHARTRGCDEASVITANRLEDHVVERARAHLHGLEVQAAEAGLDLARLDQDVDDAEAEVEAFVLDLGARRQLGESAWQGALDARVADRDARRLERDRAYSTSNLVAVARAVDDLDDHELGDLLRGMVRHVFVRRRPRGADVADRVLIVWSDDPVVLDVPGPHRSGPFEPVRW